MSIVLTDEQQLPVDQYIEHGIIVICGGPGTGKTTVIKALNIPDEVMLYCAPTGAAANRLQVATGFDAHVMAKIEWGSDLMIKYQQCNLVIDEASMANIDACNHLIAALKPKRVAFVGDHKQLPCFDGSPALNTLARTYDIPLFQLTRNHRQTDLESGLVKTIDAIGTDVFTGLIEDESLVVVYCDTDDDAIQKAADSFNENPNTTQMITFNNKTCDRLNELTASSSNKRVVCTSNFYEPKVSMPVVATGVMGHQLEDGNLEYDNGFVDKLKNKKHKTKFVSARCVNTYKAQGSEFSVDGIIVITGWNGVMPIEHMYVALSRFKTKVTIYATQARITATMSVKFNDTNVDDDVIRMLGGDRKSLRT